jgi:hypothetical protein
VALAEGLQNALWSLGGIPEQHIDFEHFPKAVGLVRRPGPPAWSERPLRQTGRPRRSICIWLAGSAGPSWLPRHSIEGRPIWPVSDLAGARTDRQAGWEPHHVRPGPGGAVRHPGGVSVPVRGWPVRAVSPICSHFGYCFQIRCIQIVLSGNSNERERRIAARIGRCGPHTVRSRGFARSADWPIGGNPLPGGVHQEGREANLPGGCASSIPVVWIVAISCWPRLLRTISRPLASEA